LPAIGLPHVATWTYVLDVLPITLAMFVVILAQSAATSRAYAARYEERHDENTDLVGLSLANVAAGLSGTFVVNGSPTKTQMVDSAGGRIQLAQLACAAVVLVVLLFLTGPLAFMPRAVLSAIVFLIGVELVDIPGMRRVLAARPREFWIALFTAAVVVVLGVEQAIIAAIALSLISHTHGGATARTIRCWCRRRPASGTRRLSRRAARPLRDWSSTAFRIASTTPMSRSSRTRCWS
jgi:MFS superfamily sulfate permease-like transporter